MKQEWGDSNVRKKQRSKVASIAEQNKKCKHLQIRDVDQHHTFQESWQFLNNLIQLQMAPVPCNQRGY